MYFRSEAFIYIYDVKPLEIVEATQPSLLDWNEMFLPNVFLFCV